MPARKTPKTWHDYITDEEELGGRMWLRMKDRGVTVNELADVLGVTINAISQLLKGKAADMKSKNLFRAADYLELEPRWLGIGEGPKERQNLHGSQHRSVFRGQIRKKPVSAASRKPNIRTAR